MTDDTFDAGNLAIDADLARASVDWFTASHGAQGDAYRLLACYAAMPLVVTPELLNYLHNRFLAHLGLPWVAEVDLLLSELLRPVDAELYAMPPATRAYLLDQLHRRAGAVEMQRVARVLIHYTRHLARTNPYLDDEELRTQQWAAMVYLDETRATAAREVAEAFAAVTTQLAAQPETAPLDVQRAEFARLAHITRLLAPQLREHRALVEYAALVSRLLAGAERGAAGYTAQVEGVTLYVPEQLRPAPAPTASGGGVDIAIQISRAPDGIYRVDIQALSEQSGFSRSFDPAAAARRATLLSGGVTDAGAARELQALGESLYDFVIASGDDGLFHRALVRGAGQGGTTLRLQIDPPELAALPWELLHDGRGFLALGDDFAVMRTLPASRPPRPLAAGAPLRIVAAAADPSDVGAPFDQAAARAQMMQALAPLRDAGLAEITWLENATVKALSVALQAGADIFYFFGHGAFEPERGGLLLFAGEAGGAQPVSAGDLASLLAGPAGPRLAILNTSMSARTDAAPPALAATLVQAGLPAAIGMQGTITVAGAIRFAQRLFDALARGQTVAAAVQAARRELAAADPDGFEWALPVLYTAAPDEALVSALAAKQEASESPVVFDWVEIPAGSFLMGSDKRKDDQAFSDELPQHRVTLPAYRMACVPVTNEQYLAFVQATGHEPPRRWSGGQVPEGKEQHPVVYVSFRDAVAFCEWASRVTGATVRLPSEAEWEKAARGTDGRIYPWGDDKPTNELCNFGDSVGDTTPVGAFPKGVSPFGVLDMAGNIWEWTSTKWVGSYENYRPDDSLEGDATRTLRGGSFGSLGGGVRCACRSRSDGGPPFHGVGFRVVSPGF